MTSIDDLLIGDRTRSDAVIGRTLERPTRTSQDELVEQAGLLRGRTRFLVNDVEDIHDQAMDIQLAVRTDEAAKRAVPDLLSELADLGFAWREISRLVGVSIPALRKWRQGGAITGSNRRSVAHLVAFVDVLHSDHLVQEVSSWMEIPIGGSSLNGLDVYAQDGAKRLLLYAAGHLGAAELLDRFEPSWRGSKDDRFEISTGSDGEPLIRMKASEDP